MTKIMTSIKTIAFDLYNTLIAFEAPKHFFLQLYKKSNNGFGLELTDYLRLVMSTDLNKLFEMLPPEFKIRYNSNCNILNQELNSVTIYEEVINTLTHLKQQYQLVLISNLATPYKAPFYHHKLNQYFDHCLFSCDEGALKPHGTLFKKAATLTKSSSNEILMIGDSYKSDIIGAKNAGWHYLMINRTRPIKNDYEIDSLMEIKRTIMAL